MCKRLDAPARPTWKEPQAVPMTPASLLAARLRADVCTGPLDAALQRAGAILAGCSSERQEAFELRLRRWWDDLADGLGELYGEQATAVADRLVELAATAYRDRDPDLHRLDARRLLEPDWLQSPRMFGYAAYADRFAANLKGVGERIGYLRELGVTYLHLMPLLCSREGDNDGGYAVSDFRTVRPDLGTVDDLRALATTLRDNGISLVLDLVLNHVAREHEWARRARAGEPAYRDYFYVYPDRTEPDRYEASLPEVFPDFAPGSFTYDEQLRGWVWTTFNAWQWDVNWSNPDVLVEYADVILFLANLGVEVIRLDAIAFTWKRLGTNCQNQPEVHALTQVLRTVARIACPAVSFKAEAIVGPRDLVQYLGQGRHFGKVSDLAYHNSLMVQFWSMLATQDVRLTAHALRGLPAIPPTASWITYLRCHDDIGWAIDDGDASAVGLDGFAHRSFLASWFAGEFTGSTARGLTFQANAATGDRRTSGTTAALTGLDSARLRGDRAAVDLAVDRILLGHSLIASASAGCPSSGWVTSWGRPTTRSGTPSPATRTTTAGCTVLRWTGSAPPDAPTRRPSKGGSSRECRTSRRRVPGCLSCTGQCPARCSARGTLASSCSPAGIRSAPCSASTTSRPRGARCPGAC